MDKIPLEYIIEKFYRRSFELFIELYLNIDYKQDSNSLYTEPKSIEIFCQIRDELKSFLENNLESEKIKEIISTYYESDYKLLCLALLKIVGNYFVTEKRAKLPYTHKDITVILSPSNPIYLSSESKVRKNVGTGFNDITDIFDKISIIPEKIERILKINFIQSKQIQKLNKYLELIKKDFRIAVTHFTKKINIETDSLLETWPHDEIITTPYWFKCIKDIDKATQKLEKILIESKEKNVNILVFPELMIDEKLLNYIQKWLKDNNKITDISPSSIRNNLLMVVAGSFHIEENGELYNISNILNYRGEILWSHKKIQRFSLNAEDIEKDPETQAFLKICKNGGHERIETSNELQILDTVIGRICVCICIDYFHYDNREEFISSSANLLLVPSMSPKTIRFKDVAKIFGSEKQISSFIANSGFIADKDKETKKITEDGASFYYLPQSKDTFTYLQEENLLIYELRISDTLV